jgi:hypothetical protein
MNYQVPGMIDGDESVDRRTARTEVLARVFADAAGGFFERRKEYEDRIADAEDEQDRMRKFGIAGVVAGLLLVGLGLTWDSIVLILVGIVGGAAIVGYAYKRHTEAEERIEEHERKIHEDEPDGEVSFVSQVSVPFYLVPYADQFMVFDGLDMAGETRLELAHIDGDALVDAGDSLEETKAEYDSLAAQGIVSAESVAEFAPDAEVHREPERPVIEQLGDITDIATDVERDVVEASVHASDEKSHSLRTFARNGHLAREDDLPTVETRRSRDECEVTVDRIRGVEQEAISGDLLDEARSELRRVTEITDDIVERLQSNPGVVSVHYDEYAGTLEPATQKHVCADCLAERSDEVTAELDLVREILSGDAGGSLGAALGDPDLEKGYRGDSRFGDRIESDLRARIPQPGDSLTEAYNTLPDLGANGGFCDIHGEVDTRPVSETGAVFGETWRSLYYAFRDPILDSAQELEREAEEMRQNKEQKMMDLTQYEQIKERAERQYQEINAEYEAAETIERRLG